MVGQSGRITSCGVGVTTWDYSKEPRQCTAIDRYKHIYVATKKLHEHIYKSLVVTSLLVAHWATALVGGLFLDACLFSLQLSQSMYSVFSLRGSLQAQVS
jgi:hypothetical protein